MSVARLFTAVGRSSSERFRLRDKEEKKEKKRVDWF
jgi:hypothetical protein